jgi:uncharacterized protein (TIGR01777 family)
MRVIITGGTGVVGTALTESLVRDGHEVIILSRNPAKAAGRLPAGARAERWDARTGRGWEALAEGAGAIVNLAGENIAGNIPPLSRWTAARKREILESRAHAGQAVVEAVQTAHDKPRVVVQASAVGYYGDGGERVLTEASPRGHNFEAEVSQVWEAATEPVEAMGVRRVIARTGLVMSHKGGIFPFIRLQFRLFAGGPLGSGQQWFPWIHVDDHVAALRFLIDSGLSGPVNLAAPEAVRYKDFARTLGKVMGRPSFIPAPAFALRLAMGEKADGLLLSSHREAPEVLLKSGFKFKYPKLEPALSDLVGKKD